MPLFARKFIIDFIETGIAAVLVLQLVVPADVEQAKEVAVVVGAAILGALVSAVRRAAPGFIEWVRGKLEVPPDA